MDFQDAKIIDFLGALESSAPTPGGGSASALAGAMGCALGAMVANLTLGREKYKEHQTLMEETIKELNIVKASLESTITRDTQAYNAVMTVFSMPKQTDEEKAIRREAMQSALKEATIVPMHMMQLSQSALQAISKICGKSNINAISDLGVGALNLKSSMQGAWLNVSINLAGIKDTAFVEEYKSRGEEILKISLPLADKIYNEVLQSL